MPKTPNFQEAPSGGSSPAEAPNDPLSPNVHARLNAVDLLRGLVMVLMALDHTRHFFSNVTFSPVDLTHTFPALFLTRWITHFCAPVFVFLAGAGAFLSASRGKTIRELSRFLVTRGLWLVLLELTYVNWFGWQFTVDLHHYGIQVIWAIGWSMVVLAGLIWLPRWFILTFGLLMIAFHNALDGIHAADAGILAGLWRVLHAGGSIHVGGQVHFGVGYPLIPWVGVMAAGYATGPLLLRQDAAVRRKWLLISGAALTALFVVIRWSNVYGDPTPWTPQKNGWFTFFSFLNCGKYPPSLCYLLMTLGPALCLLALLDRWTPRAWNPLLVFGRVPLFFYLLHLPLLQGLSLLVKHLPASARTADGFGLPGVYFFWLIAVALLYPICRWFAEFKRTHRSAWLSYL